MENIQAEEEAQPLASPRRHVAQAYKSNDRKNNLKKYSFWILTFIAFLVFSFGSGSGGDKKQKRAKKLRNKAETMPDVEVQKLQDTTRKIELNENYAKLNDAHAMFEDSEDAHLINGVMQDEDDLDREVEKVFSGVDMAEEDEIDANESMITSAVKAMEESVTFYLGKVFGNGEDEDDDDDDDDDVASGGSEDIQLSEEQLDMIAKKISVRLVDDAKSELRTKADSIKDEKNSEIDKVLTEDRDARMNAKDIADDVHEAEQVVVEDLKDEIDEAATRVKDSLPEKVKKIRNEVVEEMTGKKLDDIEEKKRARKEKKQALVKKFQEMQAKAKEAQAKQQGQLKGKEMKRNERNKSDDDSKSGQEEYKRKSKVKRYQGKMKMKEPEYSGDDEESKESEKPSVDNSPRRYKPRSEARKERNTKTYLSDGSGEDKPGSEDEEKKNQSDGSGDKSGPEDEERKRQSDGSEDEPGYENEQHAEHESSNDDDEVALASGRRDEDASEEE